MWTTVLIITLYNSVWCIHGHIHWYMQHNFLFLKVASPSQCTSLCHNVAHACLCWLYWQNFRTIQACIMLWHPAFRVTRFTRIVTNIYTSSIQHRAFHRKHRVLARIWQNPRQQKQLPACCTMSGLCARHSSPKHCRRHENDVVVMGNVH